MDDSVAYIYFYYFEKQEDKRDVSLVPKMEFPHRRLFIGDVSGMFITNDKVHNSDLHFPESSMPKIEGVYRGRFHAFDDFNSNSE